MVRILTVLASVFLASPILAQEQFKSTDAKTAEAQYELSVDKLNEEYAKRFSELKLQYKSELTNARKKSLENGDLEEAQKILEVENTLRIEEETMPSRDSRNNISARILRTRWANEKEHWYFRNEMRVEITTGGMNNWVPLDSHRIAILYENGAVDVCKFDSSFKTFEYFLGLRPDARQISRATIKK